MVALVQELIPALVLQGGLECCVKQVSGIKSRSDCAYVCSDLYIVYIYALVLDCNINDCAMLDC